MAHVAQELYNSNFTDADVPILLHYASVASHPQNCYHTCYWMTPYGVCNTQILGHDLSEHLRTCHGVSGPEKALLRCHWHNCLGEMRKESLARHIQEIHLEWKYVCPNCSERFTRNYTMQGHISRKHSGN
ncbi:hypothetical protein JVU11DRAFT_4278 [Chiua virens]|nr:hypothetical protein JVU11DRAFT_4278 [Chiua virens]